MRVVLDINNKIEMIDMNVNNHCEYIPRHLMHMPEPSEPQTKSPKLTKNLKRAQKQAPQPAPVIPEPLVNSYGVPTPVQSFLEVCLRSSRFSCPSQ